jgi:G3E family GTPase
MDQGRPVVTPVPIVLLTGFLGAGKTTLLNRLLAWPSLRERRVALLVNEFGALGVDGRLVQAGARALYEINKGSVFCICVKTDFIATLTAIVEGPAPDLLLVEATGVAETRDLEAFLELPGLKGRFEIRANLCVVDAANFLKVLPFLKPARAQVEWADALLVNKTDLAAEGEVQSVCEGLRSLNPSAPICCIERGAIKDGFLDTVRHIPREGQASTEPPPGVFSLTLQPTGPVNRRAFLDLLQSLDRELLRLKGHVDFGDGLIFVEKAGTQVEEKPALDGKTEAAFVAIAWRVDATRLEQRFRTLWE